MQLLGVVNDARFYLTGPRRSGCNDCENPASRMACPQFDSASLRHIVDRREVKAASLETIASFTSILPEIRYEDR
jgi:hypothetical protein